MKIGQYFKKFDSWAGKNLALLFVISCVLLLITTGLSIYFGKRVYELEHLWTAGEDFEPIKENFDKVIILPQNEKPSIGKIVNAAELKKSNPALYAQVEENDLLIIFSTKIIVYRPSQKRIVNILPAQ